MAIVDNKFTSLYKTIMSELRQEDRFTELLRGSLLADIKMGAYSGRIHGGAFADLTRHDPISAVEILFEFLESTGLAPEEFPFEIDSIASHLYWETEQERAAFIADYTPSSQGGNLIRHNGQPTARAEELAEFFDDLDAYRRRFTDGLGPVAE